MKSTLSHYKLVVLEKIKTDTNNPTNRKIIEWTDTHIRPNRLIHTMEREGAIKIEMVKEGKTVRRVLTPIEDVYSYKPDK
jgi:hypothetical protein